MRRIVAFIIALLACGAAFSQTLDQPPAGYARVVIYRIPNDMSAVWAKKVWLDDKQVGALRLNGYTHLLVKAGMHEIHDGEVADYHGTVIPLDAESGATYYFRYGMAPDQRPAKGDRLHLFELVPEQAALSEIEHARFQDPL